MKPVKHVLIVTAKLKIHRLLTLRRKNVPIVLHVGCILTICNSFQLVQCTGNSAAGRQSNVLARNTDIRTICVPQCCSLKRLEYLKSRVYFAVSLVTRFSLLWDVIQRKLVGFCRRSPRRTFLNCLTVEDGTDRLSRNVHSYQYMLSNILEERRSHVHRGGSLKSRQVVCIKIHKKAVQFRLLWTCYYLLLHFQCFWDSRRRLCARCYNCL